MDKLLRPEDPVPFEHVNAEGASPILFLSDHHGAAVPSALNGLGLEGKYFDDHIGRDIGIDMVGDYLTRRFDAPMVRATYSRLVVDCNRWPEDPTCVPEVSDGVVVPGNADLSEAARQARITEIHQAYHGAVAERVVAMRAGGVRPIIVALHSFTPTMDGFERPWEIAILWDKDADLAHGMLAALRGVEGLCVGDNQPYSARSPVGYSIPTHAEAGGFSHVSVEIRQDLISALAGAERYARIFGDALEAALAERLEAARREVA